MSCRQHDLEIRDLFWIDVVGRADPGAKGWDGDWLLVDVFARDKVSQVAFGGAWMLSREFKGLLDGVNGLLAGKVREFQLETLEPCLELEIRKCDDLGHFETRLVLRTDESLCSEPSFAHSVHTYTFGIDQTDLRALERQAERVLRAYPVIY